MLQPRMIDVLFIEMLKLSGIGRNFHVSHRLSQASEDFIVRTRRTTSIILVQSPSPTSKSKSEIYPVFGLAELSRSSTNPLLTVK
jgi:hypothetical protein